MTWKRTDLINVISVIIAAGSLWFAYCADKRADQEKDRADMTAARAERLERKKESWIAFLVKQLKEKDQQILQWQNKLQEEQVKQSFISPWERERAEESSQTTMRELAALQEKRTFLEKQISDLPAAD